MNLFDFQKDILQQTEDKNRVAYYLDMGLGKTFVGAEKAVSFRKPILVVCQKSKIDDWLEHFQLNYVCLVCNLTKKDEFDAFTYGYEKSKNKLVGVINYDLLFRRPELMLLNDYNFTLVLDESSLIQNENSKRSKFILRKLKPENVILLSGTPTGGKYEKLWSQMQLLGWNISKANYWSSFIRFHLWDKEGFPIKIVDGYKNVDILKDKMRSFGAVFMKTEEVHTLPEQNFITVKCKSDKALKQFMKTGIYENIIGDTPLTKLLGARKICGSLNKDKMSKLKDLLTSSDDRFLIFYNFNDELKAIEDICIELDKPVSIVNGETKDLKCYEECENSVTLIQYQSGAMGLNLQKANQIIYFTPCLSSELYEQSKKRVHRIGQTKPCFYYLLTVEDSVENKIYEALSKRKDYTDNLFKE